MVHGVLSVNIGEEYTRRLGKLVDTHKAYAKKWGYTHKLIDSWTLDSCHLSFIRFDGVLKCFEEGNEWVLYIDSDAMVNNADIPITYYVNDCPPDKDIIMMREIPLGEHCGLFGVLNTGVFMIRNTEWSKTLMRDLIRIGKECPNKCLTDQDILNQIVGQNMWLMDKFHVHEWDRKYSINGLMSFKAKTFHRDDFIIHFISCVNNNPDLIDKYIEILKNKPGDYSLKFESRHYHMHWSEVVELTPVGADWPWHTFSEQ